MKNLFYAAIAVLFLSGVSYSQGTQVLSYGYPIHNYYYYTPVVPGAVQYHQVVTGVVIDTTPRVTVLAPVLPMVQPVVHPVPVVIQPVGPVVHRCWWPVNWRYTY